MNSLALRCLVLVAAIAGTHALTTDRESVTMRLAAPLAQFPVAVGEWRGVDQPPFDEEILKVLGADDYLNRVYHGGNASAVGLYVAYYGSQRHGEAIHSPQHCLPGTGWQPVSHSRVQINAAGQPLSVNRYIVQKHGQQQLVLYWFQGRGRIVASEYVNKLYLLTDAVRLRRTDGALVRVIAPIVDEPALADRVTTAFLQVLQPQLTRWLP
jgi:EpsI family protein